jgi:hypothetical protein
MGKLTLGRRPGRQNVYLGNTMRRKITYFALDLAGERRRLRVLLPQKSMILEAMRAEIKRDAASFEAAALLFAGLEPPKEDEEE